MRTSIDLDEFLPTMDAPDKVYQLFSSLGFKVLDSHLKTNPSVYNLPVKEAVLVEKIFAVSNYDRRFQILLFKLKEESKEVIRTIPEKILREVDFPFIIFTPDFKTYTFTLVEKVREGPGEFKRKLTKLVVDSSQPYHTDKEILGSLALSTDIKNPVEVYKLFQSAFNVERVTKKFFTEYREVFEKLSKEITKQNKHLKFTLFSREGSVENFAKILLGRLMFLYFIQKRGWLNCFDGWGSGDKKFLYNKFQEAKKDKKNYFKDYLEPLFFDTLNNPRRDKPDQATMFGGRIPFLNGGLFEPEYDYTDVRNHILLENSTFDDVFSVFEKYNFTVKEDEPLEKEVAIDPEMLGKVFENLLEENLRKGKGTYYTPREIVHYMCHESLINYLASEVNLDQDVVRNFLDREQSLEKKETLSSAIREKAKVIDEKLADIKVLDPACGSGAFLVGMLHEVINARLSLNRELNRSLSEYELKKATIQNNIYGVDIDPGASEIAKLRLWLTLVVDHNLSEIEPLPNLDYKIMVGNSLLDEFMGVKLFNLEKAKGQTNGKKALKLFEDDIKQVELFEDDNKSGVLKALQELHALYFKESDPEKKKQIRTQIDKIEFDLIEATVNGEVSKLESKTKNIADLYLSKGLGIPAGEAERISKLSSQQAQILETFNEIKKSNVKPFFLFQLHFSDVFEKKGGFDVAIANPPYVKEYVNRKAFDWLRNSPYYQGKMDLWYMFACKGIDLLKNDSGILAFIAQNNWVTSYGASKMRNKVIEDTQILSLIDFGDFKIFEAGIQTMVMMFKKSKTLNTYSFDFRKLYGENLEFKDMVSILNKTNTTNAEYLTPSITRNDFLDKMLTFNNSFVESILDKIKLKANFNLDPIKEVAQGIVCPQDYVNNASQKKLGDTFKVGQGIFIISDDELDPLKLSKLEQSIIKPLYTTSELKKWYGNPKNKKWIIYTDSSFKGKNKIGDYPAIKEHLDRFRKIITSDNKPYGLHRARDEYFFKGEKIITVRKCAVPSFTYVNFDSYVSATFYVIKTVRLNQKYLTGLLNSRLIAFWLKHRGKMQGNNYQLDKEPIVALPILEADSANQKLIINIVDRILTAFKLGGQERMKIYESELDQLVYKLYGLTSEEIAFVEGKK